MKQAEKALREAGWIEIEMSETRVGDEVYDLVLGDNDLVEDPPESYNHRRVLRAPRPEVDFEPGTVARVRDNEGEEFNALMDECRFWLAVEGTYHSRSVEVISVIAYPDGSTDLTRAGNVTRIEVIDDTGRAYVNTDAKAVEFSFQDGGRTFKVFTGGTGSTPRPGDSFGQCTPDVDAVNERMNARARELLERFWATIDGKDQA